MNLVIPPRKHDLGDGFSVNRVLPYAKKRMVGPFIFWDHMGPVALTKGDEMVVRAHPHIGLATLTYLFEGQIFHKDSLGIQQPIRPGEVNWMIAGKGIVHSERTGPVPENKGKNLHGIQLWIALPLEAEEVDPSFHHFKENEIPSWEKDGVTAKIIAGSALGKTSPVPIHSPLFYLEVFADAGSNFSLDFPKQEAGVYVLSGNLQNKNGEELKPLEMGIFQESLNLQAKDKSHFMVIGGKPFPEGRHIYWNFVHSKKEKILEAKKIWTEQGFGKVPGETDFIPLPEDSLF